MPDFAAFGPSVLVAALVAVMLWFALGTGANVRLGHRLLEWLQDGLPQIGRRTTLRWLGSSAVELRLADPAPPFRDATVNVVLEPRDLPWLWAISRLRGRRDLVVVRADLHMAPRLEAQVAQPETWTGRDAVPDLGDRSWQRMDLAADRGLPSTIVAAWRGRGDPAIVERSLLRWAEAGVAVWQLSVSQTVPHLIVHLAVPPISGSRAVNAAAVFRPLRDLAVELTADRPES